MKFVNGIDSNNAEETCPRGEKEEKTALAELAVRLDKGRWNLDVHDYDKAVRIIAEIAKVEDVTKIHNLEPVQVPNIRQCYNAVVKSREIAEEGIGGGY